MNIRKFQVAAVVFVVTAAAGCSRGEKPRARSRDDAPKVVKVETVRQDSVSRSVEIVGTLAAEDQVTIASQADGAVSRVMADLGDRVKSGQVLIELDREKPQYNLDNQKAALAR